MIKVPYRADNFVPVAVLSRTPVVVVVRANDARFKTAGDFLRAMQARSRNVTIGHAGPGSPNWRCCSSRMPRRRVNAVPYKGSGPGRGRPARRPDRRRDRPDHELGAAHQERRPARAAGARPPGRHAGQRAEHGAAGHCELRRHHLRRRVRAQGHRAADRRGPAGLDLEGRWPSPSSRSRSANWAKPLAESAAYLQRLVQEDAVLAMRLCASKAASRRTERRCTAGHDRPFHPRSRWRSTTRRSFSRRWPPQASRARSASAMPTARCSRPTTRSTGGCRRPVAFPGMPRTWGR